MYKSGSDRLVYAWSLLLLIFLAAVGLVIWWGVKPFSPQTIDEQSVRHDERFVSDTRLLAKKEFGGAVYDLYPAIGGGGSGGGGVFMKDSGKCLGLLSYEAPGVTLAVPTSAIRQWTKEKCVAWAIDHTIPMPSDEELKKLLIED
ncbi:hypothetical protein A3H90_01815 [Candidatus Peribacteria bacterium RIFCSPLOWO2_02_FULL_55_36]|nr:MAG: hypothetical protein A2947_00950 [Candidatus Peribacteria bacterium RIFCSPLOWO2_01_FULL_54_110]OGJ68990.1 MAG: hypothetical protein A3H90_01815 [Candidatus Peribacteria bacterium RIFCSPLOWO2_02_FULL_55_36]